MQKRNLYRINPLDHNVYSGWMCFFSKYFNLTVYDCGTVIRYKDVIKKKLKKLWSLIRYSGNFFDIYKKPKVLKKDIKIVGDIYTNSLALTMRDKNTLYYSEFFLKTPENWKRKILFKITSLLWRNRKIIVPTIKAYETWKTVSNKIFYLPQIYLGKTYENRSLETDTLKILYVGILDDWKKNIRFFLDSLIMIKDKNIKIGLCGSNNAYSVNDKRFKLDIEKYKKIFGDKLMCYGAVDHIKLKEVYLDYNVFVLPSLIDPIGAVVMEAMAHGLPIVVSSNVGSSCYIKNGLNGYVFDSNNKISLLDCLEKLFDKKTRMMFGNNSKKIVEENYWYHNEHLMSIINGKFNAFIYS